MFNNGYADLFQLFDLAINNNENLIFIMDMSIKLLLII